MEDLNNAMMLSILLLVAVGYLIVRLTVVAIERRKQ